MEKVLKEFLFQKKIFVNDVHEEEKNVFETLFSLANLFDIHITKGETLADRGMIEFAAEQLGHIIPAPFYQGFPASVRELSSDQLLFDQLVHYMTTYGFGYFSQAGHSLFENKDFQRTAFKEDTEIKEFSIITEEEARGLLYQAANDILASSRPLNDQSLAVIKAMVLTMDYKIENCASKNTALRLAVALRDGSYASFLTLSDLIKVAEEIQWQNYQSEDLKKLNWKNQDRKFMTKLLDEKCKVPDGSFQTCYERQALWCGLLHHIHYQPKTPFGRHFVSCMRSGKNSSAYSHFEASLKQGNIRKAVEDLSREKGTGAILRNLQYIVSRVRCEEDLQFVLDKIDTNNGIILLQLLIKFAKPEDIEKILPRSFKFTKHSMLRVHHESDQEIDRRKSFITKQETEKIYALLQEKVRKLYQGRLGTVYVDQGMKNIALPLQESASSSGLGVLPKGSRIPIPAGKKIRAFTYWEKVDDIDLSVIGMTESGEQIEFSWRTMADLQSEALTYSGDQTSGFYGGSEYFDLDIQAFRKIYSGVKYLVFCNNVFSCLTFAQCFCKAGYMLRDIQDSGEVFEPKTVQTSFLINCPSTFAYLFAIDLDENEFLWLNVDKQGTVHVAGTTDISFLKDYFTRCDIFNVYDLVTMMAKRVTTDPREADLVVSDQKKDLELAQGKQVIQSCDLEKIVALMNLPMNKN
ncbi:MAG: hypothetical protein J6Z22_01595 [Lachnospiraceae bacterium]|nr:hypothetical protein [Lachnospiraceae bacterium]